MVQLLVEDKVNEKVFVPVVEGKGNEDNMLLLGGWLLAGNEDIPNGGEKLY